MKYLILILLLIPSVLAQGYAEWYTTDNNWNVEINYSFIEPTRVDYIQFNAYNESTRPRSLTFNDENYTITWVTTSYGVIDIYNTTQKDYNILIYDGFDNETMRIDEVLYLLSDEPFSLLFFEQNKDNIIILIIILILLALTSFIGAVYQLQILKLIGVFGMIVTGIMMLVSSWNLVFSLIVIIIPLIFLFETG